MGFIDKVVGLILVGLAFLIGLTFIPVIQNSTNTSAFTVIPVFNAGTNTTTYVAGSYVNVSAPGSGIVGTPLEPIIHLWPLWAVLLLIILVFVIFSKS